jgi:hypothetical protein
MCFTWHGRKKDVKYMHPQKTEAVSKAFKNTFDAASFSLFPAIPVFRVAVNLSQGGFCVYLLTPLLLAPLRGSILRIVIV